MVRLPGWQAQMELERLLWARNGDANHLAAEALHFHPLSLPTPTLTLTPSLRLVISVSTEEWLVIPGQAPDQVQNHSTVVGQG